MYQTEILHVIYRAHVYGL